MWRYTQRSGSGPAAVAVDQVVQPQASGRAACGLACLAVCLPDGGDGVVVAKNERLIWGRRDADLST